MEVLHVLKTDRAQRINWERVNKIEDKEVCYDL